MLCLFALVVAALIKGLQADPGKPTNEIKEPTAYVFAHICVYIHSQLLDIYNYICKMHSSTNIVYIFVHHSVRMTKIN